MTEILQNLKPYLDIEQDVLIEEFFYTVTRDAKESMAGYATGKVNESCVSHLLPAKKDSLCKLRTDFHSSH